MLQSTFCANHSLRVSVKKSIILLFDDIIAIVEM